MSVTDYISIGKAAGLFPGKPSPATIWRWYRKGIHGVRLQTALVGGRRYTTDEWSQEFIDATTAAADAITATEPTGRPEHIERQLDAAGVL